MGAEAGEREEEEPQGDEGQTALQPSSCADGTTAQARSQGKNQAWGGLRDSPRRLQCSGTAPAATEAWSTRSSTTGSSRHAGTGRSVRCKQGSGARRTGGCAKRAGLQCGMDVFRKETTSTAAQPSDPVCARGGGSSQTPGSGTWRKGTRAPEKREGPRPQHRGRGDATCTAEHARTRAHDTPGKDGSAAAQAVSFQGLRGGPARARSPPPCCPAGSGEKEAPRHLSISSCGSTDQMPQGSLESAIPSGSQITGLCHRRSECLTPTERDDVVTPQCRAAPSPGNQQRATAQTSECGSAPGGAGTPRACTPGTGADCRVSYRFSH